MEGFFTEFFGRWLDQFSTVPLKPKSGLNGPPAGSVGALGRQLVQEFAQLGSGLELRDRVELLEGAGECVGQTPHRTPREFLVLRLKVQPVDLGQQTPGRVQLAIDKGRIEDQLGPLIGDLRLPPVFDLALHGLEVPLDSVHSNGKGINQIEALAVLGQNRSEHAWDNVSKFP
jgi:hypothetical protein